MDPDRIRVGHPGLSYKTEKDLKTMGHNLEHKNLGCKIQAISVENGQLHGVSDPRGQGYAKGI